MDIIRYISARMRAYSAKQEAISREYAEAYRKCFEGTPEEQERRLAAWDWVHRTTRARITL